MTAVLLAVTAATPVPPDKLNPALPSALSSLILSLLEKKPADRPESAQVVWDELERIKKRPQDRSADSSGSRKALQPSPVSPPTSSKAQTTTRRGRTEPEVEVTAVKASAGRTSVKRKSSSTIRKRQSSEDTDDSENTLERRVIKLAIWVGIAVFCLIVFLILKSYFFKRTTGEESYRRKSDFQAGLVCFAGPLERTRLVNSAGMVRLNPI